ncbi:MAG TPA: SGNH/GDSL hydrolase family protein [Candidatus Dormibacteraeota bacterium]|nr:SGNH/GDSL hydrolase family protein [Candidatus Dormibacteraeota bacterium]
MRQAKSEWRWLARQLAYLLAAAWLFTCLLCVVLNQAAGSADTVTGWASPNSMALKRVGDVDSAQREPNFLSNLDCSLMEYRLPGNTTMQTGCFGATAFGLVDVDRGVAVFNGTDEGLPLLPYSPQQGSVPWPQGSGLVVLEPVSTGGTYIGLYRNPVASMQDQRDASLTLTGKKLTAPPDLLFKDAAGKLLVVNPQTMAFSDGGSWLVVETLNGSFVRINLATLDVVAFAPSFGMTGSPALLKSQVALSDNGRYAAIDNDDASVLRVYDLSTCDGVVVGLQPQKCAMHDYMPFVQQHIAGFHALRHLRFVDEGLLSFDARINGSGGGTYELAPRDSIGSLIDYLGLGDSYTSGEGAFDYLSGTDTADDMCHLSINSYPLLLTRALFSSNGGHSVACSGAVINDVGSTSSNYRGQVGGVASFNQLQQAQPALLNSIMAGYLPGYVSQQWFVRQYQPAIMTISVGGDDVGFGDIVRNCVAPHVSLHGNDNTCYGTYEDRLELTQLIDRTVPRWAALYKQLASEDPGTRMFAIGYPQIAAAGGNCGLNVHLNKSELAFAEQLIDYLNNATRQASAKAGVTYVDIGQALVGHRLCEAAGYDVAVNGLTAGNDGSVLGIRIFGKESYHPNALGQELIEQAILEQTHNLAVTPAAASSTDGHLLLDAPKSGRQVNALMPDDSLTTGVIRIGESMSVQASGTRDGLKANTTYAVKLDGANGRVLATVISSNTGDILAAITLPVDTPAGGHTINITGAGQAGEPVDVIQPVYVPAGNDDSDGDGIADTVDSCPGAINSVQDSDHDGIDDTCDGSINPPLTVGQGDSNGTGGSSNLPSAGTGSSSNGGNSLGGQLSTVVTSFVSVINAKNPMVTVQPAVQNPNNNILGTGYVPGGAIANPTRSAVPTTKTLTRLRVINWLPWIVVPLALWPLVMFGLYMNQLIGRRVHDVYI